MGFTVRRPADAEVSPCCHRPSGGDVACGVDVGVTRPRAAGDALENRLALAVFRRDVPAVGASLRRIRCGDEFEPPLGLVLQAGDQQSPPLAADLAVEAAFLRDVTPRTVTSPARGAGHRTHTQILDADGVEAARQIGGGLFHPVTAAIGFARAHPGNGPLRSRSPIDPRCARARRCCNLRSRSASPARRPGTHSNSPLDSATDTATPRSTPTTLPSPGPVTGSGMAANAMCQRPDRSRLTR